MADCFLNPNVKWTYLLLMLFIIAICITIIIYGMSIYSSGLYL